MPTILWAYARPIIDNLYLINQQLFIYSPSSQSVSPLHRTTSRLLSRRLFALHQALSADVFGLIVSNIGLASSKPLLAQLREDLKRAKKKSYTLSVGRLNPAKLANFAEIECFVLVGCAEGGVVDSKVCSLSSNRNNKLMICWCRIFWDLSLHPGNWNWHFKAQTTYGHRRIGLWTWVPFSKVMLILLS